MKNLKVGPLTSRKFESMESIILFDYSWLGDYGPRAAGFSTAKTTRHNQKTPSLTFRYRLDYAP